MAFPNEPLDVQVELLTGDTWTNITADVYTRDLISISRGQPDQSAHADPAKCTLTLNNRDGRYSPRNPMSPYYGLIGRNTPIRVSVPTDSVALVLDGSTAGYASTPDSAALDITGDLDIRLDAELDWNAARSTGLVGKWDGTAGDRSYLLDLSTGAVGLRFIFTDGTEHFASKPLPSDMPARATVRATLDADDGAGNRVVTIYWGPSVTGPWTQVGSPSTLAGTATLHAGSAPLQVSVPDSGGLVAHTPIQGRVYRVQVRSGINSTIVADADFSAQTPASTGFTDAAGLPWTVGSRASVTNHWGRFTGEVSAWPPRWDVSGHDVWVPIEAAGILRRLGQGAKALDGTLRRRIPSQPDLLAYWPLEDGATAVQGSSPVPGVAPLNLNRVTWASADSLPSSLALPVLASNGGALVDLYGPVPAPPGSSTSWLVRWIYRLDNAPADGPWTFMRILITGTAREWYIQSNTAGSRILGKDADGTTIVSQDIGTGSDLFGQWMSVEFRASQSGSTVTWVITWQDVGGDAGQFSSTFTGNVGRVRAVASPPDGYAAALDGMAIGHIAVFNATSTTAYDGAITAYAGESAINRMVRLAGEESLPLTTFDGDLTMNSTAVGPQTPETLLDLIGEAADADGGLLYEERASLGLAYRDRTTLYNQQPALTLDYTAGEIAPPLEPVEDDSTLRNDVTVTRSGGSSARAVLEEGPLSVQAPPNGVGIYDEQITLNLATDDQTAPQAYWRMHLGTWNEARYPSVTVYLNAAPHLIPEVLAVKEGDLIRLTNLPTWLAPGDVDLLVSGYGETLGITEWPITFNCQPAGPWAVGVTDDPILGRADTDSTTLTDSVDATATTLSALTPTGPWISTTAYPSEFPIDITLGGEVCTVTAIADRPTDDFQRTVTNGWGVSAGGTEWHPAGVTDMTELQVNGQSGVITLKGSAGNPRFQQILIGYADCEITVSVTPGQLATGGQMFPGVLLRASGNYYRCRTVLGTDGSVGMDVMNVGTQVGSAVAVGLTYAAGTKLNMRVNITGQRIRGRVWKAGTAEPSTWTIDQTVTGTTVDVGAIGLVASVSSANTNVNPAFAFDDFDIVSPQGLVPQFVTVVRSVNGISKAHAAGTSVQLAHPSIVAL